MYDTVNLWYDRVNIADRKPFAVLPHLSEITEKQSEKEGYCCYGKCLDYSVSCYETGISLKGSLAKSYFDGDNTGTMTRRATQNAVQKISDCLHLDLNKAQVVRFDVASIIPTKRPPTDYYRFLGEKPFFKRLQTNFETLYYNNHQKQIIFYDKRKEIKSVPEILKNENIFRYELRFLKRIKSQMKIEVTTKTLYDENFYMKVVKSWYDEFMSIQKINKHNIMINNITTVKEAENALFTYALQQLGQNTIDEFLDELKSKNTFKERQRYYELKKKLNDILTAPRGEKSDLILELERDIYNISKYAR